MIRKEPRLTAERARCLLTYDPNNGDLIWTKSGICAGWLRSDGYRGVKIDGQQYCVHRVIWLFWFGRWPKCEIDHIDRNRLNNSIANLREVTSRQNKANAGQRRNNVSGLRGACFDKRRGKWRADIRLDGRRLTLGYFNAKEEAGAAYRAAHIATHGAFSSMVGENEGEG